MTIRDSTIRSGTFLMAAQVAKAGMTAVSLIVLARLLTPDDFGVVALAMVLTNLLLIVRDLALSEAAVQQARISQRERSTLWWLNVGIGIGLSGIVLSLAGPFARAVGDPRLVGVLLGLSPVFVAVGLSAQHQSVLIRDSRFGTLSLIEVGALGASIALGVALALAGGDYRVLVVMQLTERAVEAAGLWWRSGWRPGRAFDIGAVRNPIRYGAGLTGARVLNYVTENLDRLIVGAAAGAAAVGLYAKARELLGIPMRFINAPIFRLSLATLSRLRGEPERYRRYFFEGVGLITAVSMPIVAFAFVAAEEILTVVLGPQWSASAPLMQLLAPAAFFMTFNMATGWAYVSLGHTQRQLRWSALQVLVIGVSLWVGTRWGTPGVAAAFSISMCALRFPSIAYCYRGTFLRLADLLRAIWWPASASLAAALVVLVAVAALPPVPSWQLLLAKLALYALAYALPWLLLPPGRARLAVVAGVMRDLRLRVPPAVPGERRDRPDRR